RTAGMCGLFLRQNIAVRIEQRDDTGVVPEIDGHALQAGEVWPVLPHTEVLRVADSHMFLNLTTVVEHDKPFVAPAGINAGASRRVTAEISHYDGVGMVA